MIYYPKRKINMKKGKKMTRNKKNSVTQIAIAGLMAALCFAGYALIPTVSVSGTKIHLGNTFVVIAALLTGPLLGGLAGAIGLSLADLSLGYALSMPRTFITKFLIGLIVGLVAHKAFKINKKSNVKKTTVATIVSTVAGLGFNCVFEPVLKYVWYQFLFPNAEKSAAAIKTLLALTTYTTLINTVINSIAAVLLYLAIRPVLIRAGIIVIEASETDSQA